MLQSWLYEPGRQHLFKLLIMTFSKRTSHGLLFICVLLLGSSCQRDLDLFVPDPNGINEIIIPAPVHGSITGAVIDSNNLPIPGAIVRSGANNSFTDTRGIFRFNNIELDKYASVVTVEAPGYFKAIRTFSITDGASGYLRIKPLPKRLSGTINAAAGGMVRLQANAAVELQPNSVVLKASGQAYTGQVNVYAGTIDPGDESIADLVPGSFQGIDTAGSRRLLKSFGMIAVELESTTGDPLQIAPGKTATLRFDISQALSATAPATIPLWFMNETDGLWHQEGMATREGNVYEGQVSHFSFWNCDAPNNTVYFECTFHTAAGPLPNALIKITALNTGAFSFGLTDSTGHVSGLVFSEEPLLLNVLDNCNGNAYTQTIGPFTQRTNIGNINVNLPAPASVTITGNAVDCNAQSLTSADAIVYWQGQRIAIPLVNGQFLTTLTGCSNGSTAAIEIYVVDHSTGLQSPLYMANVGSDTVRTPTLTVCGVTTTEFLYFTVDSSNYALSAPDTFRQGTTQANMFFGASLDGNQVNFNFSIAPNGIASGSVQPLLSLNSINLEAGASMTIDSTILVHIGTYGAVGEYITGSFAGTVTGTVSGMIHTVQCEFKIRRQS